MDNSTKPLSDYYKKYFMREFYGNLKVLFVLILVIAFMIFMASFRPYSTLYKVIILLVILIIVFFFVLFSKHSIRYYWDTKELNLERSVHTLTGILNAKSKYWTVYATSPEEGSKAMSVMLDAYWNSYLTNLPLEIAIYKGFHSKQIVCIELIATKELIHVFNLQ